MSLLFIRPKLQVREGQHGCNAQNPTVLTFWPPGDPPREPSIKTRYRKYMFSIHNTVIVKETSTRSCPRNKSDYFIANLAGSHFCCFSVNSVFLNIKPLLYFLHNTWFQNSPICFNMKCYMHLQKLDLGKKQEHVVALLESSVAYTTSTKDVLSFSPGYTMSKSIIHFKWPTCNLRYKV